MQVKRVSVNLLKQSQHNPKARTKRGTSALRQLERSILKIGLIYPIAVARDMTVIDGHRRLRACMNLGWDSVPVLIVESDDKNAVYADVNANSCKLTGCQNLSVWLKNPAAVTPRAAMAFAKWETLVGRSTLQQVNRAGMSLRVLRIASRIACYVESDDPSFIAVATDWLIKNRNARIVEAYMVMQQPSKNLYRAIKSGRSLQYKLV